MIDHTIDGQIIRRRRRAVGIGQEQLARLAAISVFILWRIEAGRRPVSPPEWRRLETVLQVYEEALAKLKITTAS